MTMDRQLSPHTCTITRVTSILLSWMFNMISARRTNVSKKY